MLLTQSCLLIGAQPDPCGHPANAPWLCWEDLCCKEKAMQLHLKQVDMPFMPACLDLHEKIAKSKACQSGAQLLALHICILEHICNPLLTLYVPYAKHIAV